MSHSFTAFPKPSSSQAPRNGWSFPEMGLDLSFWQATSQGPPNFGPPRPSRQPTLKNAQENTPDRFEAFWREEGERCVDSEVDTRVPNCSIFHFHKEDHTLGNLIKYQLHKNKAVLFSGYKVPHPLFPEFDLRVQTDGSLTPKLAVQTACEEVINDLGILRVKFGTEYELHRVRNIATDGNANA